MGRNVASPDHVIDDYVPWCTIEGKSHETIDWNASKLSRFTRFLKGEGLSRLVQHVAIIWTARSD